MRKVTGWVMVIALVSAMWIQGGYPALIGGLIGVAIGLAFRKKREPDEMQLQAELFCNYAASSAVIIFLLVMQAVKHDVPGEGKAYFTLLIVWAAASLAAMGLKKVWR
jgi:FtsH-binding integral membrane protein